MKLDEDPIATITFKYKTAERKFLDRVIWDRLRQNSPVYNGDTIHTAEFSEATVWFDDGTTLDLAENTMAQVFLHDDGMHGAELTSGTANIESVEGGKGFSFSSSNVQVSVKAGTRLSAERVEDSTVNLSVQRGDAVLNSGETLTEGKAVTVIDGVASAPLFSVVSPVQNQKFLYFSEEQYTVDFEWQSSEVISDLELKISTDKRFKNIVKTVKAADINKTSVELSKGTYYWQLSGTGSEEKHHKEIETCSGKFQVIQSLKPELVIPVNDYNYTYRKQNPSIRFIWDSSEAATAYNFIVSRNSDMSSPLVAQRSSSPSIIISTLGAGTYYYQVTPYYVVNHAGLQNPSDMGRFTIEQRDELKAPVLVSPGDKEFVDKTKDKTILSWQMENESVTYSINVSRQKNLSSPVISRETRDNYITLTSSEIKKLSDGEYYWGVSQTDSEGNKSELSSIRSFYALNGEIEQRTVFPPDNYVLWKPLVSDTRFTWKTNLNLMQYIQIASDRDFTNIVFDSETSGTSYSGANLENGEYYWRITTKDQNFIRGTAAKKLTVVPELSAGKIIAPTVVRRAVVRPSEPCTFSWEENKEADYYRIKIYKAGSDKVLYDQNFISDNHIEVEVDKFEEGTYRWELQAYAYESDKASRRSSMLSESNFVLRKIRPAKLLSPSNGQSFGGWDAIDNPPLLKWSSYERYSKANIVLVKKSGLDVGERIYIQDGYQQQLPALSAGEYEWYVNAYTLDDLDITSDVRYSFTVEEIPPFAAPENVKTAGGDYFDSSYLRKTPYIVFKWKEVAHADSYVLEIFGKKNKLLFTQFLTGNKTTEYKLDNLSDFAKGDFTWSVKAVLLDEEKKRILIDGIPGKGKFTINYSLNKNGGKRKKQGDLYAE